MEKIMVKEIGRLCSMNMSYEEYKVFIKKPEWNRQFGRTVDRWYNYTKIHVDEIVCEAVDRFHLIHLGSSDEPL
jgi:predicted hydrocarbon binding protein